MDGEADPWFDRELAGCRFADERLNKRRCGARLLRSCSRLTPSTAASRTRGDCWCALVRATGLMRKIVALMTTKSGAATLPPDWVRFAQ